MWSSRNRRRTRLGQTSDKPMFQGDGAILAGIAAAGNGVPGSRQAPSGNGAPAENASSDFREALARAMSLLSRREHGQSELRFKLVARGFEESVAACVVEQLRADGLQSEERFASALVRRRIERGYGPVYIRGELRERRVDDEVADAELKRTDSFWQELAADALARKFPPGNGRGESYNTRARFLARRGFPADMVYRALHARPEYA